MRLPSFPYLEHLVTLLLLTYTLNVLLSHTLPNSLISLQKFSSESATSAVSSANNSCLSQTCYHLHSAVAVLSQAPLIAYTSRTTPSIYTLIIHGDITQPCLYQTLTGNHTLT